MINKIELKTGINLAQNKVSFIEAQMEALKETLSMIATTGDTSKLATFQAGLELELIDAQERLKFADEVTEIEVTRTSIDLGSLEEAAEVAGFFSKMSSGANFVDDNEIQESEEAESIDKKDAAEWNTQTWDNFQWN